MAPASSPAAGAGQTAPPRRGRGHGLRGAGQLARALTADRPHTAVLAVLLQLASNATEAFGFLLLIPLLHAAGVGAAGDRQDRMAELLAGAADLAQADLVRAELAVPAALGLFVALAALRSAIVWQRDVLLARTRLDFVHRFRAALQDAVARAEWRFLAGQRQSDIQHVLTGDVYRIGQAAAHLVKVTVAGLLAVTQLAVAVFISPPVSAMALAAGVLFLLLTAPLLRRSRLLGDQLTGVNRVIFAHVLDFLAGLKLAKSFTAERVHVRRFAAAVDAVRRRQLATTRAGATARAALNVGTAAALAGVAWFTIVEAGLALPELAVLAAIFARVMFALVDLQQSAHELANTLPAYHHAQGMLLALRRAAEDSAGRGSEPRMPLNAALALRAVSFDYGQRGGRAALAGVTLEFPAGEITAISGPSGSGKSTLADLLLGLLEPASGAVLVDGVPLGGANRRRWRRSAAYVPQEPYLFHDTIRANLAWARPGATDDELWRALRAAAAEEFVRALRHGLDTVVGDRGGRLAGGERQRVALARALLAAPALLVLDEATSQLDARTEGRVVAALRALRGRMTIIAVAHRPAVLAAADRVVRLDSGRVAGTEPSPAPPGDQGLTGAGAGTARPSARRRA